MFCHLKILVYKSLYTKNPPDIFMFYIDFGYTVVWETILYYFNAFKLNEACFISQNNAPSWLVLYMHLKECVYSAVVG